MSSLCKDCNQRLLYQASGGMQKAAKYVEDQLRSSADYADAQVRALGVNAKELLSDKRFQVTIASAGAGGAVFGTAGAAGGTIVGSATGALLGVVPALFTFGLSIPIGAVVGGSTGLCVGAAAGTATGFVGGGVVGCIGATYGGPRTVMSFAAKRAMAVFKSRGASSQ